MVAEDTIGLLRWHAGLEGDPPDPDSVSGSLALRRGVDQAFNRFIDVLDALNQELNGPQPSAQIGEKAESIPIRAAYAVAEVARMLGDTAHVIEAWEVDTAWLAVLAGDIDDLRQHLAEEHTARPVSRQPELPG
jgi:hypothetical protein